MSKNSLKQHNPVFSVIVTAYNCQYYILETLQSIENQIFSDYEVIIVEDCSKDKTANVIKNYIVDREEWQLHCNTTNRGVAYSRNKGFDAASGDYIAILDGDDIWLENKLSEQYEVIKKNDVDLCFSSYSIMNYLSKRTPYTYKTRQHADYQSLLKENYIGCSTAVFSSKILNDIKMNERIYPEDYSFWLNILKLGYKGEGILEPLVLYRIHKKSLSFNKLNAAKHRFLLYRRGENLSMLKSIYFFIFYAFRASKKHLLIRLNIIKTTKKIFIDL